MKLDRRTLIKAGAATAAVTGSALGVRSGTASVLTVFDSRIPESAAFAKAAVGPTLDVAYEDRNFWTTLRAGVAEGRVVGLTRWSDLVVVRGELEVQGKRLKAERQKDPHAPFHWEMA